MSLPMSAGLVTSTIADVTTDVWPGCGIRASVDVTPAMSGPGVASAGGDVTPAMSGATMPLKAAGHHHGGQPPAPSRSAGGSPPGTASTGIGPTAAPRSRTDG